MVGPDGVDDDPQDVVFAEQRGVEAAVVALERGDLAGGLDDAVLAVAVLVAAVAGDLGGLRAAVAVEWGTFAAAEDRGGAVAVEVAEAAQLLHDGAGGGGVGDAVVEGAVAADEGEGEDGEREQAGEQGAGAGAGAQAQRLQRPQGGKLSRDEFMHGIAEMAQRIVKKAKEYDRDTIPGDYATLAAPCTSCGGVVKENYRRFACSGKDGATEGCGFSITKIPAGRAFEVAEAEVLLRDRKLGPLEGFRSKAGWPFTAELRIVRDDEIANWKLEFDFGEDAKAAQADGEPVDFGEQEPLGLCPKCRGRVYEHGTSYVCEPVIREPRRSIRSSRTTIAHPTRPPRGPASRSTP